MPENAEHKETGDFGVPAKSLGTWLNEKWLWVWYRLVRSFVWRFRTARRMRRLEDEQFLRMAGLPLDPKGAVDEMQKRLVNRLFFDPRNRKEFFLSVLTSLQPYDDIIDEAEEVLNNSFETLGSGVVSLGDRIDWHRDFKSGMSWPILPPSRLDLVGHRKPSDIKVPWELSRFHQVWWLGKAHWVTNSPVYADKFAALVEDWMKNNPPGLGANWALAMEASIRAANWVAGYSFFSGTTTIPSAFWVRFFKSLYIHGVFIEQNLEYAWVPANHYLSNVMGLVVLGTVFKGTSFGDRWFSWGVRQLETEMSRRVHSDGVDHEKSTLYHAYVLEMFTMATLLAKTQGHAFSQSYEARWRKMFEFIAAIARKDGTIPSFGDGDDGRVFRMRRKESPTDGRGLVSTGATVFSDGAMSRVAGGFREQSLWMTGTAGFESFRRLAPSPSTSRIFREGGYAVLRGAKAEAMIDIGSIGMEEGRGHGHVDTLSFEYSYDGRPLIVDSGTFCYTADTSAREKFRGVSSHNTLSVEGVEPISVKGLWRFGEDRTMPRVESWIVEDDRTRLIASWYPNAEGLVPLRHIRSVALEHASDILTIVDTLNHATADRITLAYHLHPDAVIESESKSNYIVRVGELKFRVSLSGGECFVEPSWFSASYGVKRRSHVIRVKWTGKGSFRGEFRVEPEV